MHTTTNACPFTVPKRLHAQGVARRAVLFCLPPQLQSGDDAIFKSVSIECFEHLHPPWDGRARLQCYRGCFGVRQTGIDSCNQPRGGWNAGCHRVYYSGRGNIYTKRLCACTSRSAQSAFLFHGFHMLAVCKRPCAYPSPQYTCHPRKHHF